MSSENDWHVLLQGREVAEGEYELQRFVPLLQELLEAQVSNSLKQDEFPYVNPPSDTGLLQHVITYRQHVQYGVKPSCLSKDCLCTDVPCCCALLGWQGSCKHRAEGQYAAWHTYRDRQRVSSMYKPMCSFFL